ncbi:putative erythritol ABC transporter 2, ATP-binding protein component [Rubellimicrobium mesophilum DSM 19309]|uniref:Putative erythritol ABC transporter 2, ATP-binding protein component n=2 Tax=Rubellimicrobium TaxID=295418 RepID=A0A017HT76_9RHOB|nr:putative erythritol ABC transporter 2, ATP-binding protein component [Rubellimicrobium mesophilum DSM 19309]
MGREIRGPRGVDFAEEAQQARALMEELEEEIDPLTPVEDLRLGQQQIVEIARALSVNSRILIMDEPTSALSASEVEVLFKVIRDLKARGVAIVYISHHLEEALTITDHAVVLRDGAMTAYAERKDIDLEWIVRHMVGENFDLGSPPTGYAMGEVALAIEEVSVPDASGADLVDRLSLSVRKGEIVCIYGLMGAGRTELLEAVAGRLPLTSGRVLLEGRDVSRLSIGERIREGLVLVPEDRQRDGLVQTMTVGENLSLASIMDFTKGLFTSRARERAVINDGIRQTQVKTSGPGAMIGSLSGGNQQKVVIGKMLATHPRVVLLDEPSRGIDVGAKAEVFRLLAEGARKGLAVVYSTSEVNECLSVAHRILVMRKGRIAAEFGPDVPKERIMAASGEVDLKQQIAQHYGLETCEIASDLHRDDLPLEALGVAGGRVLADELARGPMVLGVSHGRTLLACVGNLPALPVPGLKVVGLMGGLTRSAGINPHEVVNRLAERTKAEATVIPVPFTANSERDREVLMGQRDVASAYALAEGAGLLLVGVGTTVPEAELVTAGMVTPEEMAAIAAAGGVGEMLGHFFDAQGRPVQTEVTRRIVTLSLDRLRGRRILAVAGGGREGVRRQGGAGERLPLGPRHRRAHRPRHRRPDARRGRPPCADRRRDTSLRSRNPWQTWRPAAESAQGSSAATSTSAASSSRDGPSSR